ncbi:bifunctional cobalt-precorrin-7 (C(5))-methyltransferase/cobalt-precorrin-6B (C(15))-methyltransferase [Falsirhodobacter xinxiangensis]|uniref:bifunctional cobalt-precorrin-7 (C(5))-methyltransferase/cobalt-precorrin-6B (C(15))-methyltransferase n=1 Tax=Falsirhodobacter xinxiangensis TaxID=2530049 RepID=UPI0010AA1677|nr:bifunctional cobalt-precorrin-7 (C(5))-methyltransferase CbiE/decarboxylating cobalt-precorrin-6B (C(15))-methyltransferase CbiT [Rhodobacter xinxiangensis]
MADPWLSVIGLGEDGLSGLPGASLQALARAELVFGAPRHLELAGVGDRGRTWPVPFDLAPLLAMRGRPVAALVSGDPFWHGAGSPIAEALRPGEWAAYPVPGTFSLAAARMGWRIEATLCLGLHAAPFTRLRPHLRQGLQAILLLRDAAAVRDLAAWLDGADWGRSTMTVMERLGGPLERLRNAQAHGFTLEGIAAPVAVSLVALGGDALAAVPGRDENLFHHDGQITKSLIRAMTLAALAPHAGQMLWDLGAGSGSVSVEWALAGGRAAAVELCEDRAANIRANALQFGVDDRLAVTVAASLDALSSLPRPDAIFVGGGFSADLFARLPPARLVVNAVTLETSALLERLHAAHGGTLMRIDIARAEPLGRSQAWAPQRPLVQWVRAT